MIEAITEPQAPKQKTQTRSAAEHIAAFTTAARPSSLTAEIRQLYKRNISAPASPFTRRMGGYW